MVMSIHDVAQRAGGNFPRVHGNGFIQLDLEPGTRLHVWGHPAVPRQRVDTGIHDHRFGFHSTVVVGRVFNVRWDALPSAERLLTHKVYQPHGHSAVSENTTLVDTGMRVAAQPTRVEVVLVGRTYSMDPGEYHETCTDRPSITIMRKTALKHENQARVLVPIGKEPDNEFHRDSVLDTRRLWEIIEEVLLS